MQISGAPGPSGLPTSTTTARVQSKTITRQLHSSDVTDDGGVEEEEATKLLITEPPGKAGGREGGPLCSPTNPLPHPRTGEKDELLTPRRTATTSGNRSQSGLSGAGGEKGPRRVVQGPERIAGWNLVNRN